MTERRYPIQGGPSVPWEFMVPHEAQHKLNHGGQTLERMAQRGGLGATEAWCCVNGLKLWPTHDTDEGIANARQGWLELAEQVNREWSTKQAQAEVLAACMADVVKALSIYMEDRGRSKDEKALIGGVCLGIKNRLEQLQPVASDMEELLQAAELRSLQAIMKKASLPNPLGVGHYVIERIGELQP